MMDVSPKRDSKKFFPMNKLNNQNSPFESDKKSSVYSFNMKNSLPNPQILKNFATPKVNKKDFDYQFDEYCLKIYKEQSEKKSYESKNIASLLVTPQRVKEIEEKYKLRNTSYQENLKSRLYDEDKKIKDHLKTLSEDVEIEKMKDCTFHPKVKFFRRYFFIDIR